MQPFGRTPARGTFTKGAQSYLDRLRAGDLAPFVAADSIGDCENDAIITIQATAAGVFVVGAVGSRVTQQSKVECRRLDRRPGLGGEGPSVAGKYFSSLLDHTCGHESPGALYKLPCGSAFEPDPHLRAFDATSKGNLGARCQITRGVPSALSAGPGGASCE